MLPKTSLEQWAVLAAVVDHGGFSQAANALHKSQSAVSYAISKLQEALDVPLVAIDGRKAVLTPHGDTLLRRARRLTRDLDALEQLARSLKQGWEPRLRLVVDSAFPRARLLNIVAQLQKMCPSTQMQLSDAVLSGAEEAITEGTADVVVTTRVPQGHVGESLVDIAFIAVASPAHPLCQVGEPLTTNHLLNYVHCVVRDSGTKQPRDDGWLGANTRCTVSSMEAALGIIESGLAYAWLPEHLVRDALERGVLRPLPLVVGATRKVALSLVLVRPEIAGPAARAAVELFQRHVPPIQGSWSPGS